MLENLRCKCHICRVERHLFKSLTQPPASLRFSAIALSSPALARFSTVSELLTDLHAGRNSDSGASLAGELVPVLISAGTDVSDIELIQAVLVLAFTPAIHRTHRELCAWFRELESEDIGQQILTLFLELVTSASPTLMNSYLPIALTRTLRKNAFRWAEKEQRVAIQREAEKSVEAAEPFGYDAFETVAVLNDFLDHCQRIGILSAFERDLLIRLKVDGFFAKEIIHTHTALSEKAVHWRVERILQRLQKAANDLGIKSTSLSIAVSSQNSQKRKNSSRKAGNFCLGNQNKFSPISNIRGQLSLETSPR
jgi:DNA-directed RNA polymerase specialized sigma24 family protein